MPLLTDQVRDRIPWAQLAIESVLVVLSVLLALALDAWYDHSQEREQVRRAVRAIHTELVENRESLTFRASHHRALVDTFRTDSLSFQTPISLYLRDVNTQAWETAQQTGAVGLMDYETAAPISSVYAKVEDVEYFSRKAVDLLLDGTDYLGDTPEKLGDYDGMLNDLASTEEIALGRTKRAIEAIETRFPNLAREPRPSTGDSGSAAQAP